MVGRRQDRHEEWAITQLQKIVDLDRRHLDSLAGSAVRKVKEALTILKKRRK